MTGGKAGQTITEKLLSRVAGRHLEAGEIVWAKPELVIMHDLNAPRYLRNIEAMGATEIANPENVIIVFDHKVPAADPLAAQHAQFLLDKAKTFGLTRIYRPGNHGISHQLPADKGLVRPGMFVLASDTHAGTLGGLGALSIPVSAGLPTVLALGETWLKVPEAIRVELRGRLLPGVLARDAAMAIISRVGAESADYRSIEFVGEGLGALDIDQRMTLCNLTVEIGAKTAVAQSDARTEAYVRARTDKPMYDSVAPDGAAIYAESHVIDLSEIQPLVAVPPEPSNTKPVGELHGTKVDQVYIGSCAGGRMEDLRATADVLRGRQVLESVRCYVVPTSMDIYRQAQSEGLLSVIADAGAVILAPSCGPCYGYQAPLAAGEACIATSTRNEPGRMGSSDATIYLASAGTCAISAITGTITDPRRFDVGQNAVPAGA